MFNQIRLEMIEGIEYSENSKKTQSYYVRRQPGVIVSIRSNEHYRGAGDRKLRPRYKYRFCIVKRTKSTAFLRPCDEMSIRQYLTNEKLSKIKN